MFEFTIFTESVTELVRNLMENEEATKDDDLLLYSLILEKTVRRKRVFLSSQLISLIRDGEVPSFVSVRRTRQKLQEQYEHLRGVKWVERHTVLEPNVRDEVKRTKL